MRLSALAESATTTRAVLDRFLPLLRNPAFRRLFLLNVLLGLATSFVMPFMSMFGTLEAHMSLPEFGAFMTLNAASGIAIATTLAYLSDLYFTRRAMLLLGSLAGAAGYLGYAYFRSFLPLVLVGSLALGVFSTTFSQLFAYARELVTRSGVVPSESAFYINVFRMFIALAWTVGPALASLILERASYRGLFLCASADLLVFAWVVQRGVPSVPPSGARSTSSSAPPLAKLLARADIVAHLLAFVLVTASTTIAMMNLPLLILHTLGGREHDVGIAYCVAPFFELPFMLYFGWLATRRPPAGVIRIGMSIVVVYYISLAFVSAPWHVYFCQALQAAATAVLSGVAITYFQGHIPRYPGTATNLYANAQRVGSTAGYFLFVGLAWRFGYRAVFAACACFGGAALALMQVPVRVEFEDDPEDR